MAPEAQSATVAKPRSRSRVATVPQNEAAVASSVNKLAWPIIVENVLQTLLGTANMIMVSQLGAEAIAGIGTANQIIMVLQSLFGAITTGTIVLIARAIGAGDIRQANAVAKQSVFLGVVVSGIMALAGWFLSHGAIALMGVEPEVVDLGGAYLQIVTAASLVTVLMFVIGATLRGAGDTRTPMIVTGFINVINVVVSYLLIFGRFGFPALGVTGAAWAATIARTVGTIVLLFLLIRGNRVLSIRGRENWLPDFDIIRRLLRLGLPTMAEQLLLRFGALLYGVIAISLGTLVYATQRITFQVISFAFMPGMGFAMAATTMVGQCLGANRPDMAERSSRYAVRFALIVMCIMGVLMAIFGRPIMRLFTDDPQMIRIGAEALIVIAMSQPLQAIGQVLAGSLRGAGDTRIPMLATFTGIWLFRLPLGYLFGPVLGWGLSGIYVANIIDATGRAGVNFWRYRSGSWRQLEV